MRENNAPLPLAFLAPNFEPRLGEPMYLNAAVSTEPHD